jgi:hypothetical protein
MGMIRHTSRKRTFLARENGVTRKGEESGQTSEDVRTQSTRRPCRFKRVAKPTFCILYALHYLHFMNLLHLLHLLNRFPAFEFRAFLVLSALNFCLKHLSGLSVDWVEETRPSKITRLAHGLCNRWPIGEKVLRLCVKQNERKRSRANCRSQTNEASVDAARCMACRLKPIKSRGT